MQAERGGRRAPQCRYAIIAAASPAQRNPTLRDQDRQFFDTFMLVLGILIGVAVGLFFLVRAIALDMQGEFVLDDPTVQRQIEQRIEPVGEVVMMDSEELAAAAAAVTEPEPVETQLTGPQVYNQACNVCHAPPGVGGAPPFGDAEAWEPRIEKGFDTLSEHALNGFQGEAGFMPAKGGRTDLSDEEVVDAIRYMIEEVGGTVPEAPDGAGGGAAEDPAAGEDGGSGSGSAE